MSTSGGVGSVSSVFGRGGAVVAQNGDYTAAQVGAIAAALLGAANGAAALDAGTLVPVAELGTGAADGTKFLRGDRTWAVPGAPALTSASAYLGADTTLVAGTPVALASLALAAGTWLVAGFGAQSNAGAATLWLSTVSAGGTGAAVASCVLPGTANAGAFMAGLLVLGAAGTCYLNAETPGGFTGSIIKAADPRGVVTAGVATGLVAVKIA